MFQLFFFPIFDFDFEHIAEAASLEAQKAEIARQQAALVCFLYYYYYYFVKSCVFKYVVGGERSSACRARSRVGARTSSCA